MCPGRGRGLPGDIRSSSALRRLHPSAAPRAWLLVADTDAPTMPVRVSLANPPDAAYESIDEAIGEAFAKDHCRFVALPRPGDSTEDGPIMPHPHSDN